MASFKAQARRLRRDQLRRSATQGSAPAPAALITTQLLTGRSISIISRHRVDIVHYQDRRGSLTPVDVQAELVDGIVHRRPLLTFGALLLCDPGQREVVVLATSVPEAFRASTLPPPLH